MRCKHCSLQPLVRKSLLGSKKVQNTMEYLLSHLKILTIDKSKADSFFPWCLFIYLFIYFFLGLHPLLPLLTAFRNFYSPVVGLFQILWWEVCICACPGFWNFGVNYEFIVRLVFTLSVPLKPLLTIFTVLIPYDIDHSNNFYYIQPWKKLYEVSRRNCKMYF